MGQRHVTRGEPLPLAFRRRGGTPAGPALPRLPRHARARPGRRRAPPRARREARRAQPVAAVASRLGRRCTAPPLMGFDHVYADLLAERPRAR